METNTVIIGVDWSPDSRCALVWAQEFSRRYEAPLEAIAVWDTPPTYGRITFDADEISRLREDAHTMLSTTIDAELGDNAAITQRVERGQPAPTLIQASLQAQLLVLGSRGHSALGALLGSVSPYCIRHAMCPVAVIRDVA